MRIYIDQRFWHAKESKIKCQISKNGRILGYWMRLWKIAGPKEGFTKDVVKVFHIEFS